MYTIVPHINKAKAKIKIEYFNKFLSLNRILYMRVFRCVSSIYKLFGCADVTGVYFFVLGDNNEISALRYVVCDVYVSGYMSFSTNTYSHPNCLKSIILIDANIVRFFFILVVFALNPHMHTQETDDISWAHLFAVSAQNLYKYQQCRCSAIPPTIRRSTRPISGNNHEQYRQIQPKTHNTNM